MDYTNRYRARLFVQNSTLRLFVRLSVCLSVCLNNNNA